MFHRTTKRGMTLHTADRIHGNLVHWCQHMQRWSVQTQYNHSKHSVVRW